MLIQSLTLAVYAEQDLFDWMLPFFSGIAGGIALGLVVHIGLWAVRFIGAFINGR